MRSFLRSILLLLGTLCLCPALASGFVEAATGSVVAGPSAASAVRLSPGNKVLTGSTVITGPKSSAVLRFDDGQVIILDENSEFRISNYSFLKPDPSRDKFEFSLLKGAARSISAVLTNRTRGAFALHAPQTTIGTRGADFMVALAVSAYMSVLSGTVTATTAAGSVALGFGITAMATSSTALATAISTATLPTAISAKFKHLESIAISMPASDGRPPYRESEIKAAVAMANEPTESVDRF